MTDSDSCRVRPYIWVQFTPNHQGWIRSYECIVWDLHTGKKMSVTSLELKFEPGRITAAASYSVDENGNPCEIQRPKPYRIVTEECVVGGVATTAPPEDAIETDASIQVNLER